MSLEQLTTVEGMRQAAMTGKEIIQKLMQELTKATGTSDMVDACIQRLQNYIDAVSAQERILLNKFGVKDEAELQEAFRNFYNQSGLIKFTGNDLNRFILEDYRLGADKELKLINDFLNRRVKPEMEKIIKDIAEPDLEKYAKTVFNDVLNGMVVNITERGGDVSFKGTVSSGKPVIANNKDFSLLASKLTDAQRARIIKIIQEEERLANSTVSAEASTKGNIISTTIHIDWYSITEGRTAKWASKNLTSAQIQEKNMKIKQFILQHINGNYQSIVSNYIDMMLGPKLDNTMFFVGQNLNDITGILGEISAVVAVASLLKGVNKNEILQWVASNKVNGKQLSIDIILKGIGGIQVKNTSRDIDRIPEIDIHFAEGDASDILGKLEQYTGYQMTDLETIFESESFNVPATLQGGKFVETSLGAVFYHGYDPKDWDDFVEAYWLMDDVIQQVHQFMTAFAPDFLYMSGGWKFQNQLATLYQTLDVFGTGGNIMYIVAGRPQLMSTSLKIIQDDLRKLLYLQNKNTNFTLSTALTYLEGDKHVSYNFVDYKNQQDGVLKNASARLRSSMTFKAR